MTLEEKLLQIYLIAFHAELSGYSALLLLNFQVLLNLNPLYMKAYKLGVLNAITGDDVRSVDNLTNDQILELIKDDNYQI